jgi:alpha-1,2-mannosyltransferase
LVAVLCGLAGIAGWRVWFLILHRLLGQDWMVFYTAARAYFEGDLSLVFDGERLTNTINHQYTAWLSMPLIFHPWLYPPHFLLLLLPFGMMSFSESYILFLLLTFSAHIAAVCRLTARRLLVFFGMLLFPQTPFAFLTGQNCFLTSSLLVSGFSFVETRPLLGGALLGFATYKPQLFLMVPIALIASRQWKALGSVAATAAVLILASVAVFGLDIWKDWFHVMVSPSVTYQKWAIAGRLNGQSVYSCAVLAGASSRVANVAQALAALFGGACVWWSFSRKVPTDLRIAVLLAASLLASPHVSSQDGIFLAVGALLLFSRVIDDGGRFGEITIIIAAWVIELFDPPIIFRIGMVTPLVIAIFIVLIIKRARATMLTPEPLPPAELSKLSAQPG